MRILYLDSDGLKYPACRGKSHPPKWGDYGGCDSLLCWKHLLPLRFHIHDNPAMGIRLVEGPVQCADVALAVIGIFAIGMGRHSINMHGLIENLRI